MVRIPQLIVSPDGVQRSEDSMTWVADAQQYDQALGERVKLVVLRVYEPYLSNSPVLAEGWVLPQVRKKASGDVLDGGQTSYLRDRSYQRARPT
jgi:hypothetical protein